MRPTNELPCFVVDASVATKWHLRDEESSDAADVLLADFREGRISLIVPEQIRHEVASAVRTAVRTHRLTAALARTVIANFLAWRIPTVGNDELILLAYDLAVRFGCSLYDGLYLALAETTDCPLVYADRRLRNALGGRFPQSLWLTDYTPQPSR